MINKVGSNEAPKNLLIKYPTNNPKNGITIEVVTICVKTTLATDFSFFTFVPFLNCSVND